MKPAEFGAEFKATVTLFGGRGVGKSSLISHLVFQLEEKGEQGTPGCDIVFYQTQMDEDKGRDERKSLLIRFIDMGKFDIEANKERIIDICKMSNVICFVIDAENPKSVMYFEPYAKMALTSTQSEFVLVLNKSDKEKQLTLQSESVKKLIEEFHIKKTIEVSSLKKESVNSFGDFIKNMISEMISERKEQYLSCEKQFETCPELIYVKKVEKKTFGCL